MTSNQLQTLRWQFQMTWRLAKVHLPRLTNEACLWEPVPRCWTVRLSTDGKWRPDWADTEPDPAPPATIGWLTWHLIWWWSAALAAVRKEAPVIRQEVYWPGSADGVMARIDFLSGGWAYMLSRLDETDLETPLAYPWSEPRALKFTLGWANSELMKNVAEIGSMRHLFEASRLAP